MFEPFDSATTFAIIMAVISVLLYLLAVNVYVTGF